MLEPNANRYTGALPGSDPTLFALVNHRGFSGSGWMHFDYAAHELRDWQDAPRWLALEPGQFGADFRKLAAGSGADRLSIPDKPRPHHTVPAIAPLPVRKQTEWQLSRDLRERPLLSDPALPAWPHTEVLGRTTLQLVVTPGGDVLSARVLKSCGLGAADDFAAQAFERARFQPLPRATNASPASLAAPTLGTATVAWQTRAPATNSPATARAQ